MVEEVEGLLRVRQGGNWDSEIALSLERRTRSLALLGAPDAEGH